MRKGTLRLWAVGAAIAVAGGIGHRTAAAQARTSTLQKGLTGLTLPDPVHTLTRTHSPRAA